MLRIIFSLLFFLLLTQTSSAAIYGSDNRLEVIQVPALRPIAPAIAAAVPKLFIKKLNEQFSQVTDYEPLSGSTSANVCPDERFSRQPIIPNCTGFLISDRLLVTAGHCILPNGIIDNQIDGPFCENFSWYFNFNLDHSGKTTIDRIPESNLYGCKRIIRAENIDLSPPGHPSTNYGPDFAVIELDRPVVGIKPLKLNFGGVKNGDAVFAVGHPIGLPAKYSGQSKVFDTSNLYHFRVNLDTFGGNSGSPVFNAKYEVVAILVAGHPVDLVSDTKRGCQRVNRCDESGKKCLENSKFTELDTANNMQNLSFIQKYVNGL
jgi:V8-like Glu-specific endopeptidase